MNKKEAKQRAYGLAAGILSAAAGAGAIIGEIENFDLLESDMPKLEQALDEIIASLRKRAGENKQRAVSDESNSS